MPSLSTQIDNAAYVQPLIKESLERIKAAIISNMSSKRRNASFKSVRSLRIKTNSISGELTGKRSFAFMEKGRGAGKVPQGFSRIIEQWIRDKGISVMSVRGGSQDRQIRNVAWLIANSIRQRGTSLHYSHQFDDIFKSAIEKEFDVLSQKILVQFGSTITYINEEFANP